MSRSLFSTGRGRIAWFIWAGWMLFCGAGFNPAASPPPWTFVDLNPVDVPAYSQAHGTTPNQQAGYVDSGGGVRACIWTGSAGSLINLHPTGAVTSEAEATCGTQQAGYALLNTGLHAALWTGTAKSFVDLHPAGAAASVAQSTTDRQQTGWARFGDINHAILWSGAAASFVDLHPSGATGRSPIRLVAHSSAAMFVLAAATMPRCGPAARRRLSI